MDLADDTHETNETGADGLQYLYHTASPTKRWAVAVEQAETDRYNVVLMLKEADWPDHGVLRYWGYDDRQLAEGQYLAVQRLVKGFEEDAGMKEVLAAMPAPDRVREDD